jgi:Zn-dependent protease with chaperone function
VTATLRGLLAIALLASLYLIPAALVFGVLSGLSFLINIVGGRQQIFFTVLMVLTGGLGLWALLCIVFTSGATGTAQDRSVAVSNGAMPGLWDRVRTLAERVGTRPPAELRLTARANAEVVEETRWLGLIPVTRRMYLGVPLLVTMPQEQLDAVICHELGHYARGHTRVGAVCYRADAAAAQALGRLGLVRARSRRRGLTDVNFWILRGYQRAYRRLSFAARRRQEFQADAQAAAITGPEQTAAALRGVHGVAAAWGNFLELWEVLVALSALGGDEDGLSGQENAFAEFRQKVESDRATQEAWRAGVRNAMASSDPVDSHPSLQERLARTLGDRAGEAGDETDVPLAWPAPDIPLSPRQRGALFSEELRVRRQRAAGRPPLPVGPNPRGLAIYRMVARMFQAKPGAAALAAVVVLGGAGFGGFEGQAHAPPGPAIFASRPALPVEPAYVPPSLAPFPGISFRPVLPSGLPTFALKVPIPPITLGCVVTVQPGDTLAAYAARYGTTVAAIQRANGLGAATLIRVGERLLIPAADPFRDCPAPAAGA